MSVLDNFKTNQEKKGVDASRKVRVAIVGTGWIAEAHVASYLKQPDVEIVAATDIVPGKAEAFCERYGLKNVKFYPSCKAMTEDRDLELDGVSVCTYNRQHAPCAILCLERGWNVLLEKPFTVTTEEAIEVMRAEKKSGKILSIGFQPRLDENMITLKKIVQSGVLGKIYYVQTGGGRRRGIPTPYGTSFIEDKTAGLGALADIGCYSLDMCLNALGNPKPLTATGYKSAFFGKDPNYCNYVATGHPEYANKFEVDDFAAAFIRLEGDIVLDFRISWAMNMDTAGDTLILGTKGGLRIPSTECWNGSIGGDMTIYHEVAGQQVETKIPQHHERPGDPSNFDKKIRSFLDAIKDGGRAPVPTSEIIYNQAILDAIATSAKLGHEVNIEIPEV